MKRLRQIMLITACAAFVFACSGSDGTPIIEEQDNGEIPEIEIPEPDDETKYDETGVVYKSYNGLVMAGYQGWFAAQGDASYRGWYHYQNNGCGGFKPGCSSVDMWPDMDEYEKKYVSPFYLKDGSSAYLYSPYDEQSVDLHFKWMKEHGIDGVHMQRFVVEVVQNSKGKRHFNKVLENALKAAKKYGRAISIMYDLSGSTPAKVALLEKDWKELVEQFDLYNNIEHPTFLRHNGQPLMSIWGVGFSSESRQYSTEDVTKVVDNLRKDVSIMLGVPYHWRTLGQNDTENNPAFHDLIKKCDVIMPWAVGRYNSIESYDGSMVENDIKKAEEFGVDYVPLVFPGFSWGNLKSEYDQYDKIPRLKGKFLWRQVAGAKLAGAKSLYVAMFDEIDEATCIFKVKNRKDVPLNADLQFIGIDDDLETDHYLWLTGQAANWFHGDSGYGPLMPTRP